jgi:glycosyltransferase involved in cell wall biosynthesis
VLVNPENVFEIMRALHRVLLDQALRDKLKQRSYEQAKRFSWDASARQILRVYQEVAAKSPVRTQVADEEIASHAANS